MIVGHKIEQYLTIEPRDYGAHYEVTTHRIVHELHATKGWRRIGHARQLQRIRNLPSPRVRQEACFTRFERTRQPGPVEKPLGWLESVSKEVRDRAVNRHKVRRVEIQRAKNLAVAHA